MVKRFENFVEFAAEMKVEFTKTSNERLLNFVNLVLNLNQGCGCSRAARTRQASAEYHAIGEYLSEDNVNLLKNKWQNHRIEFAEAGAVFFVIEP
tara:strand:+ start:449 stop:733 length:285 start_codon:yes stop_codon:yes gene_type:complete